jgi:hypothetical protein
MPRNRWKIGESIAFNACGGTEMYSWIGSRNFFSADVGDMAG